jgi:hypothetical protein
MTSDQDRIKELMEMSPRELERWAKYKELEAIARHQAMVRQDQTIALGLLIVLASVVALKFLGWY